MTNSEPNRATDTNREQYQFHKGSLADSSDRNHGNWPQAISGPLVNPIHPAEVVIDCLSRRRGPSLSFVVPVLDETDTLDALYTGIAEECGSLGLSFEVVFVDDGSRDSSWLSIQLLCARFPGSALGVRLRRNCGKASALAVGVEASSGETVFTMDADLQDDPKEIPRFLEKLSEGHGLVCGWKQVRNDPWHKVYPSRIFNVMISLASGVKLHDHNCGFKCMPREVAEQLRLYGDMHRMIPAQVGHMGYSSAEIPVTHHKRNFGVSKYGISRFIAGFVDTITVYYLRRFAQRPGHLVVSLALAAFAIGSTMLGVGIARDLASGEGKVLLIVGPLLIMVALILFSTGLLEEQMAYESYSKDWKAPIAEEAGRREPGSPVSPPASMLPKPRRMS